MTYNINNHTIDDQWTINVFSDTSGISSTYNDTITIGNITVDPTYNFNYPYLNNTAIQESIGVDGKPALTVTGDADFQGDLKINGKSLNETLEKIEEKLAILHPNTELEEKWEELKNLRKRYMELESEIKEKEKVWKILKD